MILFLGYYEYRNNYYSQMLLEVADFLHEFNIKKIKNENYNR